VTHLATVVSSLPIKWFGRAAQRAVLEPCLDRLGPAGPFLQMTNALASPLPMRSLGLAGIEVARIWSEFPPVQVWRYWRPEMPSRARPRDEDA
jgi:phospholipid N-methyltransferase